MKHIKLYEEFLNEGFMSELDIIRQESSDLKSFIKSAIQEYPSLRGGETWLEELWNAADKED
jgi:hypothetical protein